jgi:putative hydrolase of the HAD superfamily
MIQAIIFDCFGVLTSDGWLPFKRKHFGRGTPAESQVTDLNKQVDAGLSDYDEFITTVADLADVPRPEAKAAIENNVANEELFTFITDELKPQYKIGLLSNAGANWLDDLFKQHQTKLFDAVCLSCDTGYVKPQPEAYLAAARSLGATPEECVFVDDQERYCTGARDVGMQAIHYRDYKQFRGELDKLLDSPKL